MIQLHKNQISATRAAIFSQHPTRFLRARAARPWAPLARWSAERLRFKLAKVELKLLDGYSIILHTYNMRQRIILISFSGLLAR
jgi:hypothetical protein